MRAAFVGAALFTVLAAACSSGSGNSAELASPGTAAGETATSIPAGLQGATGKASGPAEHDGQRTLAHVQELAGRIGERVSGTAGEAAAVEYIVAQFRGSGYVVEVMPFEFEATAFKNADVRVGGEALGAIAMSGAMTGSVSGKAVYVPRADAQSFQGRDVTGAVVIAERDGLNFRLKAEAALAAGAAGLLVVNREPGLYPGNLAGQVALPVAGVAEESGARLREAAERGETVRMTVPERTGSVNVIARPAEGAECRVLVGGHHDSVPGTSGATDNASGTATVLELARAFAADGMDEGVCWATFGGEESGLHGSRMLVERWQAEGRLPEYMLNLDVTGTGNAVELVGDSSLQSEALRLARELGIPGEVSADPPNASSDHASFRMAGVAVLMLNSNDYSTIHTAADRPEAINGTILEQVGDLGYAVLQAMVSLVARG